MTEHRETLDSLKRRIFSAPHLPQGLIFFALVIIISDIYLFLIEQPIDYWIDHSRAVSDAILVQQILEIHPLLFGGVAIAYVVVISFALFNMSFTVAESLSLNSGIYCASIKS